MKNFIKQLSDEAILSFFFFAFTFALFCGALGNTFAITVVGIIIALLIAIATIYLSIQYERNHSNSNK